MVTAFQIGRREMSMSTSVWGCAVLLDGMWLLLRSDLYGTCHKFSTSWWPREKFGFNLSLAPPSASDVCLLWLCLLSIFMISCGFESCSGSVFKSCGVLSQTWFELLVEPDHWLQLCYFPFFWYNCLQKIWQYLLADFSLHCLYCKRQLTYKRYQAGHKDLGYSIIHLHLSFSVCLLFLLSIFFDVL